jgi:hypothetical protein
MAMVVFEVGYARSSSVKLGRRVLSHALELHQDLGVTKFQKQRTTSSDDKNNFGTNLRHSSPTLSSVGDTKMLINDHINFALIIRYLQTAFSWITQHTEMSFFLCPACWTSPCRYT